MDKPKRSGEHRGKRRPPAIRSAESQESTAPSSSKSTKATSRSSIPTLFSTLGRSGSTSHQEREQSGSSTQKPTSSKAASKEHHEPRVATLMPSLGLKDISRELQHLATGPAKRVPSSGSSESHQPQPKRKKTKKYERSIDEAADDTFWERLLHNRDCDWSVVTRMLEQVGMKWMEHSQAAQRATTDWRAIEGGEQTESNSTLRQKRAKDLLRVARREQEMLLRTATRYVTVTLAYSSAATKARIPLDQQDGKIRQALTDLRHARRSLAITIGDIENYLEECRQEEQRQCEQFQRENQLLHEQIHHLRAEKQRLQQANEELEQQRESWESTTQQHGEETSRLTRQLDELRLAQFDVQRQLADVRRQLEEQRQPVQHRNEQQQVQEGDQQQQAVPQEAPPDAEEQRRHELQRNVRRMRRQLLALQEACNRIPERTLRQQFDNFNPTMQRRGKTSHHQGKTPVPTMPRTLRQKKLLRL
ncbi:hypothetical protein Q1695_009800 [Nippostrongylus brasiliensis]|nr:hypothetical protein Q1695_009800 [Nippostrongylus brasiliensis]